MHYFLQTNILGDDPLTPEFEPVIPAELALMIENNGYGQASNVQVNSAQPKIIDSEKGLDIEFLLVGSNLQGQAHNLGLTDIEFGNFISYANVVHSQLEWAYLLRLSRPTEPIYGMIAMFIIIFALQQFNADRYQ